MDHPEKETEAEVLSEDDLEGIRAAREKFSGRSSGQAIWAANVYEAYVLDPTARLGSFSEFRLQYEAGEERNRQRKEETRQVREKEDEERRAQLQRVPMGGPPHEPPKDAVRILPHVDVKKEE